MAQATRRQKSGQDWEVNGRSQRLLQRRRWKFQHRRTIALFLFPLFVSLSLSFSLSLFPMALSLSVALRLLPFLFIFRLFYVSISLSIYLSLTPVLYRNCQKSIHRLSSFLNNKIMHFRTQTRVRLLSPFRLPKTGLSAAILLASEVQARDALLGNVERHFLCRRQLPRKDLGHLGKAGKQAQETI